MRSVSSCFWVRSSEWRGAIDLRPDGVVTLDQPLVGHDLHRLEDGGVARGFRLVQDDLDVSHGERPFGPQHTKNRELGFGGVDALLDHAPELLTKIFVIVNEGSSSIQKIIGDSPIFDC